ncbi:UV DNA damage repair endonuclease UvsE [Nodosilinea sp. LEGE 06152]|uniref:UV DNA damage repair endonuclease UvsE n=1 Tax=Nodosilinea sp. LEGE 06152 TaxID=2777966 RepID=UPI0018816992|nr:UV DNA damage repair endonuclease UvsE [Nodosilinea sp. LEGE 06152]MBE9158483.1 UV DNA damage repair endonuclease UvsE [Nodosilinea sp. LEGE 06152]
MISQTLAKPQSTTNAPQLGLVCITTSPEVRFKTMTRKRLLQLDEAAQTEALQSLYGENLKRLNSAITFCQEHQIRLYRLISNVFPFSDTPLGDRILTEHSDALRQVGDRAQAAGLRLVLHPDQFVVLNSDNPTVIENSITILSAQARWFDLMGLPQSSWAAMNIHGGKGDRAERLIQVIGELPTPIRSRLTLENDEHTYSTASLLDICQAAHVPLVFDAHHHLIHERLDSYDHPNVGQMLAAVRTTWPEPTWQLVHISNGREALHDPRHSDLITTMPASYRQAPWIEVEAKHKEVAIAQLRQTWLQGAA